MLERRRFWLFLATALAIAILTIFACLALSTNYNYCVSHGGQHATGQYDQKGMPIVEPPIDNPSPINLFVYCGGIFANENGSGVTALATALLFVTTGLLWWLARNQFVANRTQLSAFVFVEDVRPQFIVDPATRQPSDLTKPREVSGWQFRPLWRNSGETQTRGMTTHVDYEYRDRELPVGFKFKDNYPYTAKMLLGPKNAAIGGSAKTFTVDEMRQVQAGTKFLYLWGWIKYEDIFQRGREHLTRYCVQVTVVTDPSKSNAAFLYPVPNEGNCSDDECTVLGLGLSEPSGLSRFLRRSLKKT